MEPSFPVFSNFKSVSKSTRISSYVFENENTDYIKIEYVGYLRVTQGIAEN